MRLGSFALILAVLCAAASHAQDPPPVKRNDANVECSLRLLTEVSLASLAIDAKTLSDWVSPIMEGVRARFRDETKGRLVIIQVNMLKKGGLELQIAGVPALSDAEVKDVRRLFDSAAAPKPKLFDFAFRIDAVIRGGPTEPGAKLTPPLVSPSDAKLQRFEKASTADQYNMLRAWAWDEAFPILAQNKNADPKFKGVVALGKRIEALEPGRPIDVEALIDRNPDFWRATLEMNSGIPTTPMVMVAAYCANGRIDRARHVAEIAWAFHDNKSVASRMLGEFRAMAAIFSAKLEARIQEGIALHDQGKFAEAQKVYNEVRSQYPYSAWAIYESFHTERTLKMAAGGDLAGVQAGWPQARAAILDADPLYHTMGAASGQQEIYELIRRGALNGLFQDPGQRAHDMIEYAEVANDLGQHAFAALIDFYVLVRIPTKSHEGRAMLEEFLDQLETLGVTQIKDNFKGDHTAAFAKIAARRKSQREALLHNPQGKPRP